MGHKPQVGHKAVFFSRDFNLYIHIHMYMYVYACILREKERGHKTFILQGTHIIPIQSFKPFLQAGMIESALVFILLWQTFVNVNVNPETPPAETHGFQAFRLVARVFICLLPLCTAVSPPS